MTVAVELDPPDADGRQWPTLYFGDASCVKQRVTFYEKELIDGIDGGSRYPYIRMHLSGGGLIQCGIDLAWLRSNVMDIRLADTFTLTSRFGWVRKGNTYRKLHDLERLVLGVS